MSGRRPGRRASWPVEVTVGGTTASVRISTARVAGPGSTRRARHCCTGPVRAITPASPPATFRSQWWAWSMRADSPARAAPGSRRAATRQSGCCRRRPTKVWPGLSRLSPVAVSVSRPGRSAGDQECSGRLCAESQCGARRTPSKSSRTGSGPKGSQAAGAGAVPARDRPTLRPCAVPPSAGIRYGGDETFGSSGERYEAALQVSPAPLTRWPMPGCRHGHDHAGCSTLARRTTVARRRGCGLCGRPTGPQLAL